MFDIVKYNVDGRKKPITNLKGLLNYLDRAGRYLDRERQNNPRDEVKYQLYKSMAEKVTQIIEQMES